MVCLNSLMGIKRAPKPESTAIGAGRPGVSRPGTLGQLAGEQGKTPQRTSGLETAKPRNQPHGPSVLRDRWRPRLANRPDSRRRNRQPGWSLPGSSRVVPLRPAVTTAPGRDPAAGWTARPAKPVAQPVASKPAVGSFPPGIHRFSRRWHLFVRRFASRSSRRKPSRQRNRPVGRLRA